MPRRPPRFWLQHPPCREKLDLVSSVAAKRGHVFPSAHYCYHRHDVFSARRHNRQQTTAASVCRHYCIGSENDVSYAGTGLEWRSSFQQGSRLKAQGCQQFESRWHVFCITNHSHHACIKILYLQKKNWGELESTIKGSCTCWAGQ